MTSNGVMPGLTHTHFARFMVSQDGEDQPGSETPKPGHERFLNNVVHQTVSIVWDSRKDIAAAVLLPASSLSDFMTGTTFRIDGSATPTL